MVKSEVEIQFINTQLQANRFVLNFLEQDIANLAIMMQTKKHSINDIKKYNEELEQRLAKLDNKNQAIVRYDY